MKRIEAEPPAGDAPARNAVKMDRRSLLVAAGSLIPGVALAQARDFGPHAAPVRYPDPNVVTLDKRFAKYKLGNAVIERLYTGLRWAEGPAWHRDGRFLVWSDIPNNRQMRWLEDDSHVS